MYVANHRFLIRRLLNVSIYLAQTLAACWLESATYPQEPACVHICKTVQLLIGEAGRRQAATPARKASSDAEAIDSCKKLLTAVLAVYFGKKTTNLLSLLTDLDQVDERVLHQVYALAFGFIDAIAQLNALSEPAHLALATAFFASEEFGGDPQYSAEIVSGLMRLKPQHELFDFVQAGGEAVMSYRKNGDIGDICDLHQMLG